MRRRPAARRQARRTVARRSRRRRRRRVLIGGAVLIGGGALVYKLTKKDADRIEQQTGVPPEELSDEELQQAMKQLGIQSQPLTAEDKAALDGADEEEELAEPASESLPEPPQAQAEANYVAQLQQLAALHDQGILTDEEFEAKKKQILGL